MIVKCRVVIVKCRVIVVKCGVVMKFFREFECKASCYCRSVQCGENNSLDGGNKVSESGMLSAVIILYTIVRLL